MLLLATGVAAQECPVAEQVGWIGIAGLACNCSITTGPVSVWSFRSEPRVTELARNSPAAGVLQPNDEIIAVDGAPITTAGAGRAFGMLTPGVPLRLTVRRDGRTVDATVTPAAVCPDDPRAGLTAPQSFPRVPMVPPARRAPAPPVAPAPSPPSLPRVAPAPPIPVVPPMPSPDGGWFGFGISCGRCGWESAGGRDRWFFEEDPRLMFVEAGSPADRAGLREGDVLVAIDGVALRTADGGRRFGAVDPGQTVRWTYRREGEDATVAVTAVDRPLDRSPAPATSGIRRYHDRIGNVEVDVVGGPSIVTTIVQPGVELIIDTGDARIRIRTTVASGVRRD